MKKGGEHGTYKRTDGGNRTVGTRTKAAQTIAGREPQKGVVQERTDKKACAVGKHLGRDAAGNQEPGRAGNPGFFRVKIIFKSYIKRALDEKSPVLLLSFWKFILYIADCCDIVHVDIIKLCQFNQCFNGNTDFSIFVIGICGLCNVEG